MAAEGEEIGLALSPVPLAAAVAAALTYMPEVQVPLVKEILGLVV